MNYRTALLVIIGTSLLVEWAGSVPLATSTEDYSTSTTATQGSWNRTGEGRSPSEIKPKKHQQQQHSTVRYELYLVPAAFALIILGIATIIIGRERRSRGRKEDKQQLVFTIQ